MRIRSPRAIKFGGKVPDQDSHGSCLVCFESSSYLLAGFLVLAITLFSCAMVQFRTLLWYSLVFYR